jgi:hypothetical protein
MSIPVTCPNCLKRFQVSDKYAGKSGPCPSCKKPLKVPEKTEEVVVHAPEEFESGGRGVTGKLALKPIAREETKVGPVKIALIVGAVALVLVGDLILGKTLFGKVILFGRFDVLVSLGLLLVSPLIALAGYTFLRNDELEPYRGTELYLRSLACGIAYLMLWGVFVYFHNFETTDYLAWVILVTPLFIGGSGAAWLSLDLEPGNAFTHYVFYLIVTNLLRVIAGLGWIWQMK